MLHYSLITFGACLGITLLIGLAGAGFWRERFVLIKNDLIFYRAFMSSIITTAIVSCYIGGIIIFTYLPRLMQFVCGG